MSRHRYDLPEPRPHEIGRTSTGVAMLLGLLMLVVFYAAIVGYALYRVMAWVMAL